MCRSEQLLILLMEEIIYFYGDPDLLADDFVRNFHLKPSRILNRIAPVSSMNELVICNDYYAVYKTRKNSIG